MERWGGFLTIFMSCSRRFFAGFQCQSAALDELLGMNQACCIRYQTAQILLHCLAQTVKHPRDKDLLNDYKKNVEKRLLLLQQRL
jgi:hypothetical protein